MNKTYRIYKLIDKIEKIFFKDIMNTYASDFYRLSELMEKETTSFLTMKEQQEIEQIIKRLDASCYLFHVLEREAKKATIWELYKRKTDDTYKGVSRMTPKERETLNKLLAKEKEEKKKYKEFEQYRQRKNIEENLSPHFHLICENLELKDDKEIDILLTYLLSENFKEHFYKREKIGVEKPPFDKERAAQIEEEIFGENNDLF